MQGREAPVGVGVIGVGQRGQKHLELLGATAGARIVAIADTHEPSLRQASRLVAGQPEDVRAYQDWRQLLADDRVEAAIVVLPNHLHAEAAIATLQLDKHLLLEKPIALTVEDCRRIEAAAECSRGLLQVGLELRYSPVVQRLRSEIAAGRIGEPRMAWCHEFREPFHEKVDDWILDPARSGGTFVEKNCHHFDLLGWLLGSEPVRVSASGGSDVVYQAQPGILDNAWAIVEHAGGKRASLGIGMFSTTPRLQLGVLGDAGLIEGDLSRREVVVHLADGTRSCVSVADPAAERVAAHGGADLLQMEDFIRAIARGERPGVTLRDGVRSLLVALAAGRAVATGRSVALDEVAASIPASQPA